MSLFDHCPTPPDWGLDWERLRSEYAVIDALHACPQDAVFHAEGDVGLHTRMACQVLADADKFRRLPAAERKIVFAAVLLHDIGKPSCTKHEDGRISSRGHSIRGDIMARTLLWRERVPLAQREAICGLIRYHQVPFFLIDRADSQTLAYRVSHVARCDHLALVAWADGVGRRCADDGDQQRIVDNVALFREYCDEHGCLTAPRRFASEHSRFLYFHKDGRDPNYHAHDDTVCNVTLLSGLPGAGKDHWVCHHAADLFVISLDAIRKQRDIDHAGPQGRVIDEGRQRAKALLRQQQSFVWNATNVSRQVREQLITLFAGYRARIKIVYVEAAEDVIHARNRARPAPVPQRAIERLLDRWTVPDLTEAHAIEIRAAP